MEIMSPSLSEANRERFFKRCTYAQLSCSYYLSTLCIAHMILDTRPSRFSCECIEKIGWGLEMRLLWLHFSYERWLVGPPSPPYHNIMCINVWWLVVTGLTLIWALQHNQVQGQSTIDRIDQFCVCTVGLAIQLLFPPLVIKEVILSKWNCSASVEEEFWTSSNSVLYEWRHKLVSFEYHVHPSWHSTFRWVYYVNTCNANCCQLLATTNILPYSDWQLSNFLLIRTSTLLSRIAIWNPKTIVGQ